MNHLILLGEPKSTNSIYQYVCRGKFPNMYMTKAGKDVKESYQWQLKGQWHAKPLECPVEIEVRLFFKRKCQHDWDNFHKLSMDALQGIVLVNDNQIMKAVVTKGSDIKNPRVEIDITPMN